MRVAAIGLALAAALLVAGCGNGNTTPGGGNASPGGNAPSVFPSVQTDDETLPPGDQPTASPADPGGAPVAT